MSLWSSSEKVYANKLNLKTVIVSSSQPSGVSQGQLWYDTVNKVLKVFDGSAWKTLCRTDAIAGDFIPVTDDAYSMGTTDKRWSVFRLAGVTNLDGFSKTMAYYPSPWGVSGSSTAKLQFISKEFDKLGEWSTSNYRFTAAKSGYYFVYVQIHSYPASLPDEGVRLSLRKNGSEIAFSEGCRGCGSDSGGDNLRQVATLVYMGAGDYLEMYVTNYNSVTLYVEPYFNFTYAAIMRVM